MLRNRPVGRGDELLGRLLSGEGGDGGLENDLLNELHDGFPITKVRLLLSSTNEKAVGAGVWVASELGAAARRTRSWAAARGQVPQTRHTARIVAFGTNHAIRSTASLVVQTAWARYR